MKKSYFKLCVAEVEERNLQEELPDVDWWWGGGGGGIWHEDGYCENTCKTLNELFSITQNKPTYAVYYSVCWTPLWRHKNMLGFYSDAHLSFQLNIYQHWNILIARCSQLSTQCWWQKLTAFLNSCLFLQRAQTLWTERAESKNFCLVYWIRIRSKN